MKHPGRLICFTGIDGSGKTTQAKMLVDWLESRGTLSQYIWSRGELLPLRSLFLLLGRRTIGFTASKINQNKKANQDYQVRKKKYKNNPVIRSVWSLTTRIEHLLQINREIRPKLRDGVVVVCDRYLWDSTIDLAVLNQKDDQWLHNLSNRLMWKLVPPPNATFFIDIPPEEAIRRKDDIQSFEEIKVRAGLYQHLVRQDSFVRIDGCDEIGVIQGKIRNAVENLLSGAG